MDVKYGQEDVLDFQAKIVKLRKDEHAPDVLNILNYLNNLLQLSNIILERLRRYINPESKEREELEKLYNNDTSPTLKQFNELERLKETLLTSIEDLEKTDPDGTTLDPTLATKVKTDIENLQSFAQGVNKSLGISHLTEYNYTPPFNKGRVALWGPFTSSKGQPAFALAAGGMSLRKRRKKRRKGTRR